MAGPWARERERTCWLADLDRHFFTAPNYYFSPPTKRVQPFARLSYAYPFRFLPFYFILFFLFSFLLFLFFSFFFFHYDITFCLTRRGCIGCLVILLPRNLVKALALLLKPPTSLLMRGPKCEELRCVVRFLRRLVAFRSYFDPTE